MNNTNYVDICCGLSYGDEAKGKLTSQLILQNKYDLVCRWSGGSNAGHTIYINGKKYHTHIIPTGIFYGITSLIGPDCYMNINDLETELNYLETNGFDTTLLKISPFTHMVTDEHKEEDLKKYVDKQGTTGKGIAPCARDKFARYGILFKDYIVQEPKWRKYIWKDNDNKKILNSRILCEGAQGFYLDINHGNYPYITSSYTLPYSACSLGFPPQYIRNIYGAAKIYDTRVGIDPDFPDTLLVDEELSNIAITGNEFGTTTGRLRKVNWLNLDKLIKAINISGTNYIIISKTDVLELLDYYKLYHNAKLYQFENITQMKEYINTKLKDECKFLLNIIYSNSPEIISSIH
jgi:adenylosuccinate synthase